MQRLCLLHNLLTIIQQSSRIHIQTSMPAARNLRVRNAHQADGAPLLHCSFPGCNYSFKSLGGLKKHLRTAHPQSSDPVEPELDSSHVPPPVNSMVSQLPCPHSSCGRTFKNKAGLTKHLRAHHKNPPPAGNSAPGWAESPTVPSQPGTPGIRNVDSPIPPVMPHSHGFTPNTRQSPLPPSSPLHEHFGFDPYNGDHQYDMDDEPHRDSTPPARENTPRSPVHENPPHTQDNPHSAHIKKTYHPVINGKYLF